MTSLQDYIVKGIGQTNTRLGSPVFTFKGTEYACVPSVSDFERQLETGGFSTGRLLTMTVPILDENENNIFTVQPSSQDIVTYNAENYRVSTVKTHPTGTYIRVIAVSTTRGV